MSELRQKLIHEPFFWKAVRVLAEADADREARGPRITTSPRQLSELCDELVPTLEIAFNYLELIAPLREKYLSSPREINVIAQTEANSLRTFLSELLGDIS